MKALLMSTALVLALTYEATALEEESISEPVLGTHWKVWHRPSDKSCWAQVGEPGSRAFNLTFDTHIRMNFFNTRWSHPDHDEMLTFTFDNGTIVSFPARAQLEWLFNLDVPSADLWDNMVRSRNVVIRNDQGRELMTLSITGIDRALKAVMECERRLNP